MLVNLTFEYYFKRKDNIRVQVFLLCNVLQGDRQVRDIPARPQVQSLRVKCLQQDRRGPVLLFPRPKLVSISKVIEGILVICPVPTSKKMCGKMWLKQRKARPRELYTISNRYANCYVQHDSYKLRKPLLTCFGKM